MAVHSILRKSLSTENRGVSETLEILFLMSMTSIIVGIILFNFHSLVKDVEEESKYATFQNIAGKIISDIHSIQALTIYPGELEIRKKLEIPEYVGGQQYTIILTNNSLIITQDKYRIEMPVSIQIPIRESSAISVNAYLVYNLSTGTLEVKNG